MGAEHPSAAELFSLAGVFCFLSSSRVSLSVKKPWEIVCLTSAFSFLKVFFFSSLTSFHLLLFSFSLFGFGGANVLPTAMLSPRRAKWARKTGVGPRWVSRSRSRAAWQVPAPAARPRLPIHGCSGPTEGVLEGCHFRQSLWGEVDAGRTCFTCPGGYRDGETVWDRSDISHRAPKALEHFTKNKIQWKAKEKKSFLVIYLL